MFDQPLPQEPVSPPPSRHPLRRPERRSLSDAGLKDFRNVVSEANELGGASARATRSARDAYAAVPPPPAPAPDVDHHEPQFDRTEQRMLEQHEVHERPPHEDFPEPMLEPSFTVDETRPAPPKARRAPPPHVEDEEEELEREEARPPRSYGGIIRAAAAFVIVACLAGVVVWQWSNMVALYRVFRAPSTEVVTRDPPPTAQKKDPGRLEPGSPPQETSPAAGRGGRPEGGALRGGSGRSAGQALRRLGALADRDRVAGPGTAARARDPRRRRGARAQARDDLVAAPQHRQVAAGEPHRRDHVQAAGRTFPPAASPTCPAS